jgi:hypothetical protein
MIDAMDIELIRSIARDIAREEVQGRIEPLMPAINGDDGRIENAIENAIKPSPISITDLEKPFPFEIVVEFDPPYLEVPPDSEESIPRTIHVYVRNGAFVMNEADGTHKFVATNELTSEAAYTLYEVPNGIAADKTIWAKLDMSSTEPVATIEDEQPDDDPEVFYVCIGKVNAYGGIEQYVFGHIPHGGGSGVDYSKFAFGYKLVSIAGDTEEDPSTPGVEITPGSVRMHGLRVYTMAEAEIVALTGTPCIVTLVVDRTATAPASITFEVSSVVADSTSTSLRIPLYSFKQMGDSYALELIYSLGDINFDQPIR